MRSLLAALVLIGAVVGCNSPAPEIPAAEPKVLMLEQGTPVDLILAKQINAGSTNEGESVPMLVSEDVKDAQGNTLIPKGAIATGVVTTPRSEGPLSGLMNRPARLEVELTGFDAPDGTHIDVNTDEERKETIYKFTRENTGKPSADENKIDDLLKDEMNRQVAEKLSAAFEGQSPDLSTPEAKEALNKFANELGLNDTKKLIDSGKADYGQLANTIQRLQKGDYSGLTKGDLSLNLNSVMELANLAGGLGSRLSRSLKGRTIHAYPGTPLRVYVRNRVPIRYTP